jgi:hypothetical protein
VATEKETTVIDDVLEPTTPIPPARPRRAKLAVAAIALAAVLAGGLAIATSGDREPEPLALVAGAAAGFSQNERASGAPAPAVAPLAAADSKMAIDAPYWGGIEYRVDGDLPDLGDHATAWRVNGPDVDRATVTRWAQALGLSGTPQLRDGTWTLESGDAFFNVYPGDGWSISFNRNPGERRSGDVSAAAAERQARDLLARLGVLDGEWRVQVFETEIGVGYACAEDLKLRAEEMARIDPDGTVSNDAGVASGPAVSTIAPSMPSMPDCPPPPPPVKAQNVSFFPVVDGERVEWSVWNLTIGAEGVESLYGNWVTFERGDEYKLRSVDAALEELRQGGRAYPMPMATEASPPVEPAVDPVAVDSGDAVTSGSVGGGTSGSAGSASSGFASGSAGMATPTSAPAAPVPAPVPADVAPAPMPAIAPYPYYPCPPETDCVAPEPQVVTITDVDLVLQPQAVWSERTSTPKMFLVPAYRFTGTFKDGSAWETTVVALHPDAIAPPPAVTGVVEDVAPAKGTVATSAPMPPVDMAPTTAPAKPPVR